MLYTKTPAPDRKSPPSRKITKSKSKHCSSNFIYSTGDDASNRRVAMRFKRFEFVRYWPKISKQYFKTYSRFKNSLKIFFREIPIVPANKNFFEKDILKYIAYMDVA